MGQNDDDPTDLEQQEQARLEQGKAATRAEQIHQDDIRRLMSSKWGRRLVHRLLGTSGVFRSSFDINALTMAFNEGNRNLGNQLLGDIANLCPDRYLEMLKEHKQHDRSNNRSAD